MTLWEMFEKAKGEETTDKRYEIGQISEKTKKPIQRNSACRITADTKIRLKKLTKDRVYQIGETSEKTGKIKVANGKWVDPKKAKNTTKEADNKSMRIKSGLKKTKEITDYLSNKLEKMGFKTQTDYSGLSGSQYITISNYSEMTGKESDYNGEELKIRISNHDLPPSYDGLHGYHDIDIMSEGKERPGNDGNATSYETFLHMMAKKIGLNTPEYDKKLEEIQQREKEKEERIKQLRENEKTKKSNSLTASLEKLKKDDEEKYNKMQELLAKLDEHTIEYGTRKNKYTGKERKKMTTKLKEILRPYGYEPTLW